MLEGEDVNPIELNLYIRQRKSLITLSLIIIAINLVGGELKTEQGGSSAFILPFGVTFEISRPWLIDWLLFAGLLYLIMRYIIFSKDVRDFLTKARYEYYRYYIPALDEALIRHPVQTDHIYVESKLWKWKYSAGSFSSGIYNTIRKGVPLPARKTLWPTLITEVRLFHDLNSYTDYYSPFIIAWLAILSYSVKLW